MATFTTLGRELVKAKLPDKYKQYADRPLEQELELSDHLRGFRSLGY